MTLRVRITRPAIIRFVVVSIVVASIGALKADDSESLLPISATVKSMATTGTQPSPPADAVPMMNREAPVATLPSERLPQYQMGYQRRDLLTQVGGEEGKFRFLVLAPSAVQHIGRPILVQLAVVVDQKPFPTSRQQAIETLTRPSAAITEPTNAPSAAEPTVETTIDTEARSDVPNSDATDEQGSETETSDQPEPKSPRKPSYQLATEASEMVRRYSAAIGESVSDQEVNWLLTHWTEGPTLLLLHPYFQHFRADQRPAFVVLDRDRDDIISHQELMGAVESFRNCDANRDDIVDVLEITAAANSKRERGSESTAASPLLVLLMDLDRMTQADPVSFRTIEAFDINENGRIDPAEVQALQDRLPDIDIVAEFDSSDPTQSKLSIVSVDSSLHASVEVAAQTEGINVKIGETVLNFSAVQSTSTDQISLGAVFDGFPLLPVLDPNDDGRFTIRELRQLQERLQSFDVDRDNQLTLQEVVSPARICVGLGAAVHRELAGVRSIKMVDTTETVTGPEWFVRMDRNSDNDLTPGEFPGTDEQFRALDSDGDQLISAAEALRSEQQSTQSENE